MKVKEVLNIIKTTMQDIPEFTEDSDLKIDGNIIEYTFAEPTPHLAYVSTGRWDEGHHVGIIFKNCKCRIGYDHHDEDTQK